MGALRWIVFSIRRGSAAWADSLLDGDTRRFLRYCLQTGTKRGGCNHAINERRSVKQVKCQVERQDTHYPGEGLTPSPFRLQLLVQHQAAGPRTIGRAACISVWGTRFTFCRDCLGLLLISAAFVLPTSTP